MKNISALVIGDVPNIFIERFKIIFRCFVICFIPIVEKCSSGDKFCIYINSLQPDFVLISFEDYSKHPSFYDDLMKSSSVFWKISTNRSWHVDEIDNELKRTKKEYLEKR
jgi:hypothetical protein